MTGFWIDTFELRRQMLDALYTLHHAEDPLLVLRTAATLREIGAAIREKATADARAAGATWAQIAEASRSSRQAEHRKYHHLDDENGTA
jgi:hypothetical protein